MKISYDENNRILKYGEPIFILGMYDSGLDYNSYDSSWEHWLFEETGSRRMQDLPFNFYLNYWFGKAPLSAMNSMMNVLQNHDDIMYLQTANCFESGFNRTFSTITDDAYLSGISAHPGFAGIYLMDECSSSVAPQAFLDQMRYRTFDPDSITFGVSNKLNSLSYWRDAIDFLAMDSYPMYGAEPAGGYDLASGHGVAGSTKATKLAIKDSRPIATALQFFQFTSQGRWPTKNELRNMSYMAIAEGADGLFYWSLGVNALAYICDGSTPYYSPFGSASWCQAKIDRMNDLKEVTTELKNIEPVLVSLDRTDLLSSNTNSNIKTLVKYVNNKGYVISYNYTGVTTTSTFTWSNQPTSIIAYNENRSLANSGFSWTDTFLPYEAHVYEINTGAIPSPVIPSFIATPSTINSGQASILSWSVNGASSISINNGVGVVTGSSVSVSPTQTTTYTLTATNASGSVTKTVTVTVSAEIVSTHTITASEDPHSTITPKGSVSVENGASQTFAITAKTGYGIQSVVVDGVNKGALASFQFQNVSANHTISVTSFVCDKDISNPGRFNPNATGFTLSSITDPRTAQNFSITKSNIGKILFKQQLNLLRANSQGCYSKINIASPDVEIQNNSIKILSANIPELNQPAELTFYGVNYANPLVKRDGLICQTCTIASYDKTNHVLIVNVPGFSTYTLSESAICGNSKIENIEQCDDGNTRNGDGCSSTCLTETSYTCIGEPSVCTKNIQNSGGSSDSSSGSTTQIKVTNIKVVTTENSATITWNTDRSSLSWIKYGKATSYGKEDKTVEYFTSHQLVLTNLTQKTAYHYQIKTFDRNNIEGSSTDAIFTTLESGVDTNTDIKTTTPPATSYTGIPAGFTFQKNLPVGAISQDVVYLKMILVGEGCGAGITNTTYYGPKTKANVQCFQNKYKAQISKFSGYIISATGLVGPGTRSQLNALVSKYTSTNTNTEDNQARIQELLQMIKSLQEQIQKILLERGAVGN